MKASFYAGWRWLGRRWREKWLVPLAMAAATARAQPPEQEEPRWFSLHLSDAYLSLDSEAEQETDNSSHGGGKITSQRLYLAPSVGLGAIGSIYHPDLFAFTLKAEPGYVWQQTGVAGVNNTQNSFLQSYDFSGTALQLKPYSTTFFANAGHNTYQYDFFNTVVADQRTWGINTGYREGPVPVTIAFQDSHQDINGLSENTTFDQTSLNLHAHNDRNGSDATDLTYLYGQYGQTVGGGSGFSDTSSYHQVNLTDAEHFGKSTLNSTLLFNQLLDSQNLASRDLTATLDLGVEHTEHFHSSYGYSFSHYDDDVSEVDQHFLRAGVQHQLFESLSSALDVHGIDLQSSAAGSRLDSQRGGILAAVNYTKRLGSWGRLTLGDTANYDVTKQTSSGSLLSIPQESHSVTTATPQFRLNQPLDVFISSVTADATHGFQPLQQGVDYLVDQSVDPWQITINFTSLTIQHLESSGSVTVLISYDATPNPSGTYSTFSDQFNVRLDLFQGMLGFYSRLSLIQNDSDTQGFVLENLTEFQAGSDFNWRGLRLDARYLNHRSSLYDYDAKTLSESYSFNLEADSRAGVDLRQQWSDYPSQRQSATYYDFLAHYEWQDPRLRLTWSVEGGLQRQRGLGLDQDLLVARTHLEWHIGKINLHVGYDYQNRDFNGETMARHFAYLRFRRNF